MEKMEIKKENASSKKRKHENYENNKENNKEKKEKKEEKKVDIDIMDIIKKYF